MCKDRKETTKKLNVEKLKDKQIQNKLEERMNERLDDEEDISKKRETGEFDVHYSR